MNEFRRHVEAMLHGRAADYRSFEVKPPIALDCERFAFYLPQFHRDEANDRFWGSGFTEWTNVVRALPKFRGHVQPRLPGDLGFYDLSLEDNLRRQVEIALNYGLTGFMFYLYWFGGKTVLEAPVRTFLRRRDLKLRFFVMWANENWTRRWDGLEDKVLLQQTYAADEPEKFVRHLCDYLEDERYLRVEGRPVIAVYCASQIPDVRNVTERWREACLKHGFKNPYLVSALTFKEGAPANIGFDAALEFPPHQMSVGRRFMPANLREGLRAYFPPLRGRVWAYKAVIQSQLSVRPRDYRMFRTAFPGWDNTARRRDGNALICANATPKLFAQWTTTLLREELKKDAKLRMICFNAWNEWAEAAYLEPDAYRGYACLEAVYDAIATVAKESAARRKPGRGLPGGRVEDARRPR